MRKKISFFMAMCMVIMMSFTSYAAEVGSLSDCRITIGIVSNGISISCDTNSTTRADEIGVKDVVLQEKVNGVWKNINIAGGSKKDSYDYVGSVVYTNAVKGRSYRAHCTHYAKYGSTTKTLYGEVGPIVYN
ncbi:MAG: hypothetical protein ACLR9I_02710 [Eisenbergiella sp.]